MLFLNGILRCSHEGCTETLHALVPATGGKPENTGDWLLPNVAESYCPAHVSDYVPPHEPTDEEVRAELKATGLPEDLVEAMVAENRRQ